MKITLQNLTKKFPSRNKKVREDVIAVNDFTFEIPDGKLIGLLGPSGCGKSTALNLLCGLQKPTSGKIYFGELTFFHWSGMVPFEPEYWNEMFGSWIALPARGIK